MNGEIETLRKLLLSRDEFVHLSRTVGDLTSIMLS